MKTGLIAGVSRFAHLAVGLSPRVRAEETDDKEPKGKKSKAAEDDDRKDEDDKEPKGKKSKAAEDDDRKDEDDKEPKGKKSKAAEDDDDDDDGKDEDDKEPKGRKSKAAEEDDEDDDSDEMTGKSAAASARRRERARCAAIFACKSAAANPALAASLAFDTTLTRVEAVKVLKGQGGAPRGDRASRNPDLDHGANGGRGGKAEALSGWDRAHAKATRSLQADPTSMDRSLRRAAGI